MDGRDILRAARASSIHSRVRELPAARHVPCVEVGALKRFRPRITVGRLMILIAVAAVPMALATIRSSYCWRMASNHDLLVLFHNSEAAKASALARDHRQRARERAEQLVGSVDVERAVALDAEAKGHRVEALFQLYTTNYHRNVALWHTARGKTYRDAAIRPWMVLPKGPETPPWRRPMRSE